MFIDIVVVVLRETLEASILIGVLLSVSKSLNYKSTWLYLSLAAGFVGALFYGFNMGDVSEWFDYTGQEVVNASLQLSLYALVTLLIAFRWRTYKHQRLLLASLMACTVFVAIVREGSELFVFYSGFLLQENRLFNALNSGFIGLTIGLSMGAIVFYVLVMMKQTRIKIVHAVILALVASGMVLQATQLLIQADWISAGVPIWDTSAFISETSITGQVAYAVFGYEATPSLVELVIYLSSIAVLIAASLIVVKTRPLTVTV